MKNFNSLLSASVAVIVILSSYNANATKWIVNVQNFMFSPSNIPNVIVGDTIRWVWLNGSHTTTSTTIPGFATSWDHPINSGNTFYEYPVTVAGNYNYHCTPHAGMGMIGSFTATALTPTLVSIDPNQAVQSTSFLATITGSNTNFSGSPAVSLSFSGNPGEIINAGSVTIVSPTVLHAQFTIPVSASVGLWDVNVNSLVLNNGFNVILAVPAILSFMPYNGNQGASFTATIIGQYTGWSGTPSVSLSFSGDPGEVITGTNVVVQFSTHLTADFVIPIDASPGFYNVHVDTLQLTNGFSVVELFPFLLYMAPNSALQGNSFNGTIIGQNTSWAGTPSVYLSFSGDPTELITGTNVIVINNTELTADFSVPFDASSGGYNIHVDTLELTNGFTVLPILTPILTGIDPTAGDQGTIVSTTISAENTSFEGSSPTVSLNLHANPSPLIFGSNVVVIDNTTLTADFDIPYNAAPGLWDLNVDDLILQNSFTVNEVIPHIVSIDPDSAYQGEMEMSSVTAVNSRFTLTEPVVYISYSSDTSEVITASNVMVISDNQLDVMISIPSDASIGEWDYHVGDMVMLQGFKVNLMIGINDPLAANIKTYPNPAGNWLFIENATGADVTVYNAAGQNILCEKILSGKQALDISQFVRGIYLVRMHIDGNDRIEKFLKN